jgi:hypothetical protein
MNHVNSGSVSTTTSRVHATTDRVYVTIGRVHVIISGLSETIDRAPATVGMMSEKIVAEYHTCLTSYRAEPDTLDMSHRWSEHIR